MVLAYSNSSLTTAANRIQKIRYFNIELQALSMQPNTKYDFYDDGVLKNAFCKQYGKNLGDSLISDQQGRLLMQYHLGISYGQTYISNKIPEGSSENYIASSKKFEFRDAKGNSSSIYYPVRQKATV